MKSELKRKRVGGAADKPSPTVARAMGLSLSNIVCLLLGAGLTALVGTALSRSRTTPGAGTTHAATVPSAPAQPGPWGELEFTTFSLERPDAELANESNRFPAARWMFEGYTTGKLAELFQSLETTPGTRQQLLDQSRWEVTPDGIVLHPTREMLGGLRQPARQKLYPILGDSRKNLSQFHPFRYRGGGFDEWFAASGLPAEALDIVRDHAYSNRFGALCISDVSVLQERLTSAEFRQALQTLYSEPTLLVSLRVRPASDIRALAAYWGRGGREREVQPVLKSLTRMPGGGSISITHLLPNFARLRLYTAQSETNVSNNMQDCLWSAVNFLLREPNPQPAPGVEPYDLLMRDFARTAELPLLGDVLLLLESEKAIHACVFVADDVVFTKNGASAQQPWILMRLTDVIARYSTGQPLSMAVLRRKDLSP